MKTKSFLLGAAALMLATACSNDEVVKVAENSAAIGFNSFVNNSTRADYGSDAKPENLNVYGVSTNAEINPFIVFNGDVVTNTGSAWTYSPLRYWISGNDYTFAAVAPAGVATVEQGNGTNAGGIETITFTNTGDIDLLYAEAAATGVAADNPNVEFTMGHMLSRVRFQFDNGMHSNYSIKVSDVHITNVLTEGTINKAKAETVWTATEDKTADFEFAMADEYTASSKYARSAHKYVIPTGKYAYNAIFTIELYDNGTGAIVKTFKHTDVTLPELDYTAGLSYTLKANINDTNIDPEEELEPIVFDVVKVNDWAEYIENEVPGFE